MKLSEWAKRKGLSYKTAYRIYKRGLLPCPSEQLATGTILVYPEAPDSPHGVALYARVSSRDQHDTLERQLQRLRHFAAAKGYQVIKEIKEIGSGLNGRRPRLIKALRNPAIHIILAEHKDRITRFGFEFLQASMAASHRSIIVINDEECKDDLVQDMIEVLTSFCARLYGRRAARIRARKAVEVIEQC